MGRTKIAKKVSLAQRFRKYLGEKVSKRLYLQVTDIWPFLCVHKSFTDQVSSSCVWFGLLLGVENQGMKQRMF